MSSAGHPATSTATSIPVGGGIETCEGRKQNLITPL